MSQDPMPSQPSHLIGSRLTRHLQLPCSPNWLWSLESLTRTTFNRFIIRTWATGTQRRFRWSVCGCSYSVQTNLRHGQYAMYLEVWRSQQQTLSPTFLWALCQHAIRMLISARTNCVTYEIAEAQHRSNRHNSEWLKAAMEQFKRSMDRLYGKWLGAAEVRCKNCGAHLGGRLTFAAEWT